MNYEFISLQKTELAQKVAAAFNKPLHEASFTQFADGELNIIIQKPAQFKNKIAVIIQSTGHPVNDFVLGIAFLAHELKNSGATKVIAVVPYFGYSRQERSSIPGKPGYTAVIAKLFEQSGINELITVELHDKKIMDFFSITIHNLSVQSLIADHIKKQQLSSGSTCLIAPDEGRHVYVKAIADQLHTGMITFSKERFAPDQTRVTGSDGHCKGTISIVIDDIIATGGTVINVANALPDCGFQVIYGYFVHPVLADNAVARLKKSKFKKVFVGNTLELPSDAQHQSYITPFDVSPVIITALNQLLH